MKENLRNHIYTLGQFQEEYDELYDKIFKRTIEKTHIFQTIEDSDYYVHELEVTSDTFSGGEEQICLRLVFINGHVIILKEEVNYLENYDGNDDYLDAVQQCYEQYVQLMYIAIACIEANEVFPFDNAAAYCEDDNHEFEDRIMDMAQKIRTGTSKPTIQKEKKRRR